MSAMRSAASMDQIQTSRALVSSSGGPIVGNHNSKIGRDSNSRDSGRREGGNVGIIHSKIRLALGIIGSARMEPGTA